MNPTLLNQPAAPQNINNGPANPQQPLGGSLPNLPPQVPTTQSSNNFGSPPTNFPSAVPSAPPPQPIAQPLTAPSNFGPQQVDIMPRPSQSQPEPAPTNVALKANPNSTQNALQITEIRDGIVIMNDGSFRSVIMVKSINFDLMSQQEREAVEYSYQGFLNSLYFPVQIFIHSRKVDLGPYIQKLDKIRTEHENMLLALLMEDYIDYMAQLAQQTNIMDKKFYLVIPYFPIIDVQKALTASKNLFTGVAALFSSKQQHVTVNEDDLEKAKAELRNRVQASLAGLLQCGIQGLPLDTQELIELYYDVYNPDTATRQELKNFNNLSAPVITKGQGQAPQPNLDRELQ